MLPLGVASISREDNFSGRYLASVVAKGADLVGELPWLEIGYRGNIRETGSGSLKRNLLSLPDINEAIYVNVLGPGMRFENHVDFWRANAILVAQMSPCNGGHLTLARNKLARTYNETISDFRADIVPEPGSMIFVAAQNIPHVATAIEPGTSATNPDARLSEKDMRDLLDRTVFEEPDIGSDEFWDNARIAPNLTYSDEEFNQFLREQSEVFGVARFVHGLPEEAITI